MKTVARRSRQGKLMSSSAPGSSLGVPSLRVLRKGQGRGGLPRGREHHEKGLPELGEEETLQEQTAVT